MPLPRSPPPPYDFVQPTEVIFIDDDLGSFLFAKDKTDGEPKIKLNLQKMTQTKMFALSLLMMKFKLQKT